MYEDRNGISRQDDIRRTWKVPPMQAEPKSHSVQARADRAFRRCMVLTYPRHQCASRASGQDIDHPEF